MIGRLLTKLSSRRFLPWSVFDYSKMHVFQLPFPFDFELPNNLFTENIIPRQLNLVAECRSMRDIKAGIAALMPRFEKKCLCRGLFNNERMVGYAWAKIDTNVCEDRDSWKMIAGNDSAYIFDTYIAPEFRGKKLYPALIGALCELLITENVNRFYLTVDAYNVRSLKAHKKLGAQKIETVTYLRFLGFRIHFSVTESGKKYCMLDLPWRKREFISKVVSYGIGVKSINS